MEAQNKSNPGCFLLKRTIYYCSHMISAQKNVEFTGSDYDSIQKVYSIWVCSNAPEGEQSTITAYAMKEQQLVGHVIKDPEEYDLLSVIMIRLGDVPLHDNSSINEAKLDQNVIGMLEILLKGGSSAKQRKGILESHYGIEMTEQIEEEVGHMCNLSQGVLERGMEKGLFQGAIARLKKAMEKNGWTLEQAVSFFDLPISE